MGLMGSIIKSAVSSAVSTAAGKLSGSAKKPSSSGGSSQSSSGGSYTGTNYHQDAITAAQNGDWNAVSAALNARQDKVDAQGGNDRGTSNDEIWASLVSQYGGNAAKVPQVETPAASDYSDYLKEMYAQNTAAQLAALKDTYQQNAADLSASAEKIPETFNASRNEAAAQNDIARQRFNEYAASQGLNTGASGQAALANSAVLQGNLASIGAKQSTAMSENALEQDKLTIAYKNAYDQAVASGNGELASALYQEYVRQDQAAKDAAAAAQEQANWATQFNAGQSATGKEYAYNLASTMLSAGVMPDASTLASAGISATDAAAMQRAALAGKTTGTGSTAKTSTASAGTQQAAAETGNSIVKDISALSPDSFANEHSDGMVRLDIGKSTQWMTWAAAQNMVSAGKLKAVKDGSGKFYLTA